MGASPERPSDDVGWLDASLLEVNKERIRALVSRSVRAQNSSAVSIDAPLIDLRRSARQITFHQGHVCTVSMP